MHALRSTSLKWTFNEILECVFLGVVVFVGVSLSCSWCLLITSDNMTSTICDRKKQTNKNNVVYCKGSEVKRNKKRKKKIAGA